MLCHSIWTKLWTECVPSCIRTHLGLVGMCRGKGREIRKLEIWKKNLILYLFIYLPFFPILDLQLTMTNCPVGKFKLLTSFNHALVGSLIFHTVQVYLKLYRMLATAIAGTLSLHL